MNTRMRAINLRLQVRYAQDGVRDSLRDFNKSREKYMDMVRSLQIESQDMTPMTLLESDEKVLQERMAELHDLFNEMTDLDSELLREDGKKAGVLETDYVRNLLETGQIAASSMQTVRDSTYEDDDNGSEPDMPDLLRKYFDVIGELRLMQERLVDELPYEHADQRIQRQRRMDQDEMISETEEDFEEKCRHEIENVHGEIDALRLRVDKLHAEVIAAGLDPDPTRYQRHSPSGSVVDWLDSVATPVDLPMEDLEAVESLAGSTKTSRPVSPAPSSILQECDIPQVVGSTASVSPRARPTRLREGMTTIECHDLSSPSMNNEDTNAISVQPTGRLTQHIQERESQDNSSEQQWVVLLSPEISRHESPDRATITSNPSNASLSNLVAVMDGDMASMQSVTPSSGSARTTCCQSISTHHERHVNDEAANEEASNECGCGITLYTFSGMVTLQEQRPSYFARGVVFETSLADQLPTKPFLAQAVALESCIKLMVFKRNARDCIACPILPRNSDRDDMDVIYVKEQEDSKHQERNGLRVRTLLPDVSTEEPMRLAWAETVPVPYETKVRPIGSLEEKSLFNLIQMLGEVERNMYSIRSS